MEATILDTTPISGEYPEVSFHPDAQCLWILFIDDDFNEWVGVFGCNRGPKIRVTLDAEKQTALVSAAGRVYYVDLMSRKERWFKDFKFSGEALLIPKSNEILYVDDLMIQIWNEAGEVVWSSKRISWDGVTIESFDGRIVRGELNDLSPKGVACSFDVAKRELKSSWVYSNPI